MSTLGTPPGKKTGSLPFKRTAKRRAAPPADKGPAEDEDESLRIFNQRKLTYFDDQQKLAAEKATRREQVSKGKAKASKHADEAHSLGSLEPKTSSPIRRRDSGAHSPKRQRAVVVSEDEAESDEEIFSRRTKTKRSKTSLRGSTTPKKSRASLGRKATPPSSKPSKTIARSPPDPRDVISIDDSDNSDDEFIPSSVSRKGKGKMVAHTTNGDPVTEASQYLADDASSDAEVYTYAAGDIESKYIREARERMERRARERLAREANAEESGDSDPAAEILIESRLEGVPNLKIKIQISKKMQLVREAWAARSKQRLQELGSKIRLAVVDGMFFTWKGNKIYDFTTLNGLGIKPADEHRGLFPSLQSPPEGYVDWDKVHIEAWTQELYDQHQAHLERESRRRLGDLDEDDASDAEPEPASPARLRIILRSKDLGDQPLRAPLHCSIKLMVKAFRSQRKEQLQPGQPIALHFDGEVLDETSTIEDVGIEDGDVIEVHL